MEDGGGWGGTRTQRHTPHTSTSRSEGGCHLAQTLVDTMFSLRVEQQEGAAATAAATAVAAEGGAGEGGERMPVD